LRPFTFYFQIRNQLEEFEISVYEFPRDEDGAESSDIRAPFAIVGSNAIVEDSAGRRFRGRRYPWGCVNIEDQVNTFYN
jgi:septin 7